MKREISYRGKRKDANEWIISTGVLVVLGGCYLAIETEESKYNHDSTEIMWIEVIPETIGQFINVNGYVGDYENRHKNEVKLFEDDIVEAWSEGIKSTFIIKMRTEAQPTFILFPAYQNGKMWSISASNLGRKMGDYYDDLKKIGNVFDNPELIIS